jgi:hypothetical protein
MAHSEDEALRYTTIQPSPPATASAWVWLGAPSDSNRSGPAPKSAPMATLKTSNDLDSATSLLSQTITKRPPGAKACGPVSLTGTTTPPGSRTLPSLATRATARPECAQVTRQWVPSQPTCGRAA